MELSTINKLDKQAISGSQGEILRLGIGLLFVIGVLGYSLSAHAAITSHYMLAVAAVIGGYMAMNIGANDVANNVGPAVGSRAMTMLSAIIIAAIFEATGALIAGGDVVGTIKKGIIDPALIGNTDTFIWLMMAALLAGAVWLNIATAFGAPVSTTHSIVGGVLGAGIAAGGFEIANWVKMGQIAASWVISPVMGGIIAAAFLYLIKRTITYRKDMLLAAKRMVPILVALMVWAFSTYLVLKGLKKLWKVDFGTALAIGGVVALLSWTVIKPLISKRAAILSTGKDGINSLFTWPLIFAAALLSFAHGANDVANAVGPLAAINDALVHGAVAVKTAIPLWVMVVGALGIAIGLALYGPKLIRTVGSEITELDQMRAFCIAMAAAITVIIASQLGLPVSSTHIAVGGVFGVGFLREYLKRQHAGNLEEIRSHHNSQSKDDVEIQEYLDRYTTAPIDQKELMLEELRAHTAKVELTKKERKQLCRIYKEQLVKRSALLKIAAAWVITVPASGLMAAIFYFTIRGFMMP